MEYIGLFASVTEAVKQGEFDKTGSTIEKLTGRKPTSLNDFLNKIYSK
jgi:hypothetical protein